MLLMYKHSKHCYNNKTVNNSANIFATATYLCLVFVFSAGFTSARNTDLNTFMNAVLFITITNIRIKLKCRY